MTLTHAPGNPKRSRTKESHSLLIRLSRKPRASMTSDWQLMASLLLKVNTSNVHFVDLPISRRSGSQTRHSTHFPTLLATLRFSLDKGMSVLPGADELWHIKENMATPLDIPAPTAALTPLKDGPIGVQFTNVNPAMGQSGRVFVLCRAKAMRRLRQPLMFVDSLTHHPVSCTVACTAAFTAVGGGGFVERREDGHLYGATIESAEKVSNRTMMHDFCATCTHTLTNHTTIASRTRWSRPLSPD